jgi:hypothetical protein
MPRDAGRRAPCHWQPSRSGLDQWLAQEEARATYRDTMHFDFINGYSARCSTGQQPAREDYAVAQPCSRKLSITALSWQLPRRLMLQVMP